jgi:hypothetical protein
MGHSLPFVPGIFGSKFFCGTRRDLPSAVPSSNIGVFGEVSQKSSISSYNESVEEKSGSSFEGWMIGFLLPPVG